MRFDPNSPPQTYREFRKSVMRSLEYIDMNYDDEYPSALFLVNREPEGKVIYAEEVQEEHEIPMEVAIMYALPEEIRSYNSKYFALCVAGSHTDELDEETEILTLLSGDIETTDMMCAEIYRDEDRNYAELEPWQELDVMNFSELVVPYRRSIVPQG
jgi:hypothetical protein